MADMHLIELLHYTKGYIIYLAVCILFYPLFKDSTPFNKKIHLLSLIIPVGLIIHRIWYFYWFAKYIPNPDYFAWLQNKNVNNAIIKLILMVSNILFLLAFGLTCFIKSRTKK